MALKHILPATYLLTFSLAAWSGDAKDADAIQGAWLPASAEFAGKAFPEEVRRTIKLVIKGNNYSVTLGDKVDQGTIKFIASTKPKQMDITGTEGPNKGKTFLAIYDRTGDTLRICYDLSGTKRPTEFKTKEGATQFLVIYTREKP